MKKIKHILCFFLFLGVFLYSYSVFAASSIRLDTSKKQIDIQETLELRIDIELENQKESVQIEVPGINDFMVLGQSQSQSTTSINGVTSQNFTLILTLKGKESGSYELGPIRIGDLESNTQTVEITGEQVFIGGQIDTGQSLTRKEEDDKIEASEQKLTDEYKKQFEEEKNKKIIEEYGTDTAPENFRDIKKLTHVSPIHIKNSIFLALILGLIFTCYKIYMYFIARLQEKESTEIITEEKEIIQKQTDFQSLLRDIESHHLDTRKEIFYGKLGALMREYFDEKVENGLSTKTFGELKIHIKKYPSLTRLYEKIYFPEYNLEADTTEQRIKIINTLKDELI